MSKGTIEFKNDVLLVVDGAPISLSVKTQLLKRHGYDVLEAETGADALAIAAAKRPALILLASPLRDVDVSDVRRQLKAQSETQFIKVLQISRTHVGAQEKLKGQAVEADAYLAEPAEEKEVLATVRVLLKLAEQEYENRRLIERLSDAGRIRLEPSQASQAAHAEVGLKKGQAQSASEPEAVGAMVDEGQKRLADIVENSADAIIGKDLQGIITSWNRGAEALLGYTEREMIGRPVTLLFPPDRVEEERIILDRLKAGEPIRHYETVRRRKDGRDICVSLTISPIRDQWGAILGASKIMRDITDRKQTEAALNESEGRLRLFIEHAPAGLAMFDRDMRYLAATRRWKTDYHLPPDVEGHSHYEYFPHLPDKWMEAHRRGLAGEVLRGKADPFRGRDGTTQWITWEVRPWYAVPGIVGGILIGADDVTTEVMAQQALRESEARLQAIMDRAPAAIFVRDREGRSLFMNEACAHVMGFDHTQVQGKTEYELYPVELAEQFRRNDQVVWKSGRAHVFEEYVPQSDGLHTYVSNKFLLSDTEGSPYALCGIAWDITSRRRMEQALRESEERFRQLSTSLPLLAWTCLPDGSCDFLSHQWIAYTGIHESHQREFGWLKQLHPDDRSRTIAAWNAAVQGIADDFHVEFRLRRYDGVYRWFDTKAVRARDDAGRTVKWYGFNTDITERKLAEEGLREAHERLQHWNVALELAVQAKTKELQQSQDHLRAMATELNLAEQRERKRLATDLHDHLQQMLVAGKIMIGQGRRTAEDISVHETILKKIDDILTDALTYSRTLVAELSPPVLRDHGLAASLKWLAEYMQKYHDQIVTVILPEDEKYNLPDNHVILLFQSTRELLINSAKHAGTGQATLSIEEREDRLYITLKDNGKGFDPAGAEAPYGGSSSKFGLFSIKERMRALGGSLIIDSAPGQGTTAILALPLARTRNSEGREEKTGERDSMDQRMSTEQPTAHPRLNPGAIRVVLVDDHAMVRQGLHSMLDAYMDIHVVGEAKDGAEAIKSVEELLPQVVVMDINMPKMNGIEATKHITRLHPDIIVIGISVNTGDDNSGAMQRAGAVTLLTKEAAVEQLYTTIQEAVKKRQSSGRL